MSYLPAILIVLLLFRKQKFNYNMIPSIITLIQNMPTFSLDDILYGRIDITSFSPVIDAITDILQFSTDTSVGEVTPLQGEELKPICTFANDNITYSLNGFFSEN